MAAQSWLAGGPHAGLPGKWIPGADYGRAPRAQRSFRDHLRLRANLRCLRHFQLSEIYWAPGELFTSSVSMVMVISSLTIPAAPFTPKSLRLMVVLADAPMWMFPL